MTFPWRADNRLSLLINGEAFFPRVFAAIRAAEREVLIETFILFEDKVGSQLQAELIAAAARGVRVELTVDGYGSADLSDAFVTAMSEVGVRVHMFDPQPRLLGMRTNLFRRMHRKLVVIDDRQAFVGGINFSADHLADYGPEAKQDYAVEVEGPVVHDIRQFVLTMLAPPAQRRRGWRRRARATPGSQAADQAGAGSGQAQLVIRDNRQHRIDIEQQYLQAIRGARQRLLIANAYFFPGYRLLREIRHAAQRGVRVELILQGQPDMPIARFSARILYDYLLRGGVRILEYDSRPLHGKVALVDDEWATVGSSNLDPLSLSLNLEANLIIRDRTFNRQLFEHLQALASEHCQAISQAQLARWAFWRMPLVFLGFHLLRHFPAWTGWLPAHTPKLALLQPHEQAKAARSDALRRERQ
ncbi:MAG: cardiolipin synthase ClsB [Pseudomonas sp.]|uniref:cardiolipin synthase ClsB n=1 Tax=Pseudomonas sp. TaxID=306 RepID=UPI00299EAF6B|nr:cardiolipin synthase ClsB [Pseudomonas sp.]MDX1726044.1 cardiolipin synthase ClsB [Pseudomonas sp.]